MLVTLAAAFRSQRFAAAVFLAFVGGRIPDAQGAPEAEEESVAEATQASPVRSSQVELSNGLRVVLMPERDAPVLSVCTTFDAGVRRDPPGAPGTARVVAELLRHGGRPTEGQDLPALVARRGGSVDIEVGIDASSFCTTVPSAELDFALWLEAGRLTSAALTQRALDEAVESLSAEFERSDEVPVSRAQRRLRALAFQGRSAYSRVPLPSAAQLSELELAQVKAFHKKHYGPGQAVLTIVGDFDPAQGRDLLERYFGHATGSDALPPVHVDLPHQTTERFSMMEDPTAKTPSVWYGWVLPPLGDKQRAALEVAAIALSTRLEGSIVGPQRVAQSLESQLSTEVGPQLFSLFAVGTGAASLEGIQKALDAELSKIGQFGVGPEELARAKETLRRRRAAELASNLGRARELGRSVLLGLDRAQTLGLDADSADAADSNITGATVAGAVRAYLHSRRRSLVEIYPKGWSDPWQVPMPVFHLVSAGENLIRIATRYGTTVDVIAKMNGLDAKKPIFPGQKLKVPRGKATQVKSVVHTVRAGDTLSAIASKHKVTVRELADFNGIDPKRAIRPGDEIRVPSGASGSTKAKPSGASSASEKTHQVKAGDTLGGIAKRYGVTTASLAAANGLGNKTTIRIGQTLKIPAATSGVASSRDTQAKPASRVHRVRSGETLGGIAKKYGVSIDAITKANGISRNKPIRVGQELVIPR